MDIGTCLQKSKLTSRGLLQHQLTSAPLPIAHDDGALRQLTKFFLMRSSQMALYLKSYRVNTYLYAIDDIALVQPIEKPKYGITFGDLGESFSQYVFINSTRSDVVFDQIPKNSIKEPMR